MKNSIIKIGSLLFFLITGFAFRLSPPAGKHSDANHAKAQKIEETINYNIVFAPDLSNRLDQKLFPRPLTDPAILQSLLVNIYPKILRYGRSSYQTDKFSVDFINPMLINQYKADKDKLKIDFGGFKTQAERIGYILARPGNENNNLAKDINEMKKEYGRIDELACRQHYGADIWTYLNEGIDNRQVSLEPDNQFKDENGDIHINAYHNVLILVTDGYIEAGIYGKGFDLSQKFINNFRNKFLSSKEKELTAFFEKNKQYRITPVKNRYLRNVDVMVMEMYDRSVGTGGANIHPTDMEIMKLFWSDWLKQSGVKRFALYPIMQSRHDTEEAMLKFIGVR